MKELEAILVEEKTGQEPFLDGDQELNFNLAEFWSWSQSNLLSNSLRGILAEFIVKKDLGIENGTRTEWDAYDLETESGIRIEVKSAAYLQSWKQRRLSNILFDIAPKKGWNSRTNEFATEISRQSDFYVFCLQNHKDKASVDPLNLNQWNFYVIKTEILNREKVNQKIISLNSLLKLNPIVCKFGEIKNVIHLRQEQNAAQ